MNKSVYWDINVLWFERKPLKIIVIKSPIKKKKKKKKKKEFNTD